MRVGAALFAVWIATAAHAQDPMPKALIIGDSISIGYMEPLQELLAGTAEVTHNPGNARHTGWGLEHLEEWLGNTDWNVIHFNFGLHDLKYVGDDGTNAKSKESGHIQVPLEQYRVNLEAIVKRLKQTNATIIFATTTSFPPGTSPPRDPEDVDRYNATAVEIMNANGVTVNDLGAWSKPRLAEIQRPNNVHFTDTGYAVLAEKVAEAIKAALLPN